MTNQSLTSLRRLLKNNTILAIVFLCGFMMPFNSCDDGPFNSNADQLDLVPKVFTGDISQIGNNQATVSGNLLWNQGTTVDEKGICYSTSGIPDFNSSKISLNGDLGDFSATLQNLNPATTYFVRAYAKKNQIIYGELKSFTTAGSNPNLPLLTTNSISNITSGSAISGGNITSNGGSTVTSRGICYSTTSNPTTNNATVISGSGTGSFVANMSGLSSGTTYYVRAFATNSAGTAYGNQVSFTTLGASVSLPTVTTNSASSITANAAVSGGNVTNNGGATVTSRGICYSTTSNPTTNNATVISGSGTGSFVANMSGLSPGTTYYVRAFATNSAGIAYGNQVSFTTLGASVSLPTVTTNSASSITANTAVSGGNVTNSGGATVTSRGICYSTTSNPTTNNATVLSGSGTGSFVGNMSGLSPGTTYYVRAFATNSAGTAYGNQITFQTLQATLIGSNNCSSLSGFNTSFVRWTGTSYAWTPWTINPNGYSGSCLIADDPTLSGGDALGGYVEFTRVFSNAGYFRFWISNTFNGPNGMLRPQVIIDGVNTTPTDVSSPVNGWLQLQSVGVSSGPHTIRLNWPQTGQYYYYKVDQIQFWEY